MKKIAFAVLFGCLSAQAFATGSFSVKNNLPNGYYIHLGPNGGSSDISMGSNPDGDSWYLDGAYAGSGGQAYYYVQSPDEFELFKQYNQIFPDIYNSEASIGIYIYNSDNNLITKCYPNAYYANAGHINLFQDSNNNNESLCNNPAYYVQSNNSSTLSVYSTLGNGQTTTNGNSLCFTDNGNNDVVSFKTDTPNDYAITPSQSWGGVSTQTSGSNKGCLNVMAGRSNSASVVAWIKTQGVIGQHWNDVSIASNDSNDPPTQLNFAFYGTLTITDNGETYTCPGVGIAQGHSGDHNYWYIFNNAKADQDGPGSSLACSNGKYLTYTDISSEYNISISMIKPD